jgi:hypothetical protein
MTPITPEARAGVMRVWISILEERYPGTKWYPVSERDDEREDERDDDEDLDADRERDDRP